MNIKYLWKQRNQGMTLLEQVLVTTLIGILSAIASPSFFTVYNNQQLKGATDGVYIALLNAQKQALRTSQKCTINFEKKTTENFTTMTTKQPGCLVSTITKLPDGVLVTTSLKDLTFSFRGLPNQTGIIIVSLPKKANVERCVEILDGLGLVKQGIYRNTKCNLQY